MKESMIIYRSFVVAGKKIKNKNQRLAYYEAIFDFGLDEKEPTLDDVADAVFEVVKPQIVANNTRYSNGLKGGRKRRNQSETESGKNENQIKTKSEPNQNQNETKSEPNVNVNVNENVNVNDNVNVNVNENELEESKNNLFDSFEKEFARPLTPIEFQLISDLESRYGENLVSAALSESIRNGKRSIRYIEAILTNWNAAGVRTVEEAHEMIKNFNLKKGTEKNKLPDWYTDPDEKTTPASKDDVEELKKILDEMG